MIMIMFYVCPQDGESVLTFAIRTQNADAVDALISHGANVNAANARDVTPLSAAAHKGNLRVMLALMHAGALVDGVNSTGSTALIQVQHILPRSRFLK